MAGVAGICAGASFCLDKAKALLNEPYSCFKCVEHTKRITLPHYFIGDHKTGAKEMLNLGLNRYSESLDGILIAYYNTTIKNRHGSIVDDLPYIMFDVAAKFIVFRPHKGSTLRGIVNKVSCDHIGCLVHEYFNVSLLKPHDEEWNSPHIQKGSSVLFEVTALDLHGRVLFIRGKLLEVESTEPVNRPENDDSDDSSEGEKSDESSLNTTVIMSPNKSLKGSPGSLKKFKMGTESDSDELARVIQLDADSKANEKNATTACKLGKNQKTMTSDDDSSSDSDSDSNAPSRLKPVTKDSDNGSSLKPVSPNMDDENLKRIASEKVSPDKKRKKKGKTNLKTKAKSSETCMTDSDASSDAEEKSSDHNKKKKENSKSMAKTTVPKEMALLERSEPEISKKAHVKKRTKNSKEKSPEKAKVSLPLDSQAEAKLLSEAAIKTESMSSDSEGPELEVPKKTPAKKNSKGKSPEKAKVALRSDKDKMLTESGIKVSPTSSESELDGFKGVNGSEVPKKSAVKKRVKIAKEKSPKGGNVTLQFDSEAESKVIAESGIKEVPALSGSGSDGYEPEVSKRMAAKKRAINSKDPKGVKVALQFDSPSGNKVSAESDVKAKLDSDRSQPEVPKKTPAKKRSTNPKGAKVTTKTKGKALAEFAVKKIPANPVASLLDEDEIRRIFESAELEKLSKTKTAAGGESLRHKKKKKHKDKKKKSKKSKSDLEKKASKDRKKKRKRDDGESISGTKRSKKS